VLDVTVTGHFLIDELQSQLGFTPIIEIGGVTIDAANQNQTAPGQANSFEITLLVDSLSDGRFRVADFGPIRLGVAGLDVAGVTFDGEINIDIFATPVAVPELDDSQTASFSNITVEFLLFEDDWNATTQIHAVKLLNGPDGVKNFGGAAGVGFTFDGFEIFADEAGLFPDANDPTTALAVAHGIVLEIITAGQFTASALDLTLQVSDLFTVEVGPLASGDPAFTFNLDKNMPPGHELAHVVQLKISTNPDRLVDSARNPLTATLSDLRLRNNGFSLGNATLGPNTQVLDANIGLRFALGDLSQTTFEFTLNEVSLDALRISFGGLMACTARGGTLNFQHGPDEPIATFGELGLHFPGLTGLGDPRAFSVLFTGGLVSTSTDDGGIGFPIEATFQNLELDLEDLAVGRPAQKHRRLRDRRRLGDSTRRGRVLQLRRLGGCRRFPHVPAARCAGDSDG